MSHLRTDPAPQFTYAWEGTDPQGRRLRGRLQAAGAALARAQLRRQGIAATRLGRLPRLPCRGAGGVAPRDRAVLLRQLATLLRAGVPLLQALDLVGRGQPKPALAEVLHDLRREVATGRGLAAAMERHPRVFATLTCRLVAVGESGGVLDQTLERLAAHEEKSLALRNRVRAALLYPAALLTVALAVVTLMLIAVVPTFESVFASFGTELPTATRLIIALSEGLARWWWLVLVLMATAGVGVRAALRQWPALGHLLQAASLRLPVVGPLLSGALLARWTRTLATLLGAGIPLVNALGSVAAVAGHQVYAQATQGVQREVSTGQRLAQALQRCGVFPPMLVQMAAIGEESGSLEQLLAKTAEFHESELDERIKGLSSLLEPFIIVVLGLLIGGIIVAMYLPIFQMGSMA